jgi:flavin reductase (DIM6/NTAB) family NADH-FMN oxidoreductase RutF
MSKVSLPASNQFCPQCLYLYGTDKQNGDPNWGLFCWATYCWDDGLRFVACIGEDKLTRDRIRETGVFSASILSADLLPAADFCGDHPG